MNIVQVFINLFKGGDVWQKLAVAMSLAGAFAAGADSNDTGTDDKIAKICTIGGDALTAYKSNDGKKVVKAIDTIIYILQTIRTEFFTKLQPFEQQAVNAAKEQLSEQLK